MQDWGSARAMAVALRTYCRPLDEAGTVFESWDRVAERSMYDHQGRLWIEAGGEPDLAELEELKQLGVARKALVAGRTLWLGGTKYAYDRPICQFNCAATQCLSVLDVVDLAWMLLNGSGTGFKPEIGILHGHHKPIRKFDVVPTERGPYDKGPEANQESVEQKDGEAVWTIRVGDSAQAWAKVFGKIFHLPPQRIDRLVLDTSQCRGPGGRLKGYGWICNGPEPLTAALKAIHEIRNRKAGNLLDEIDIMDAINWIGTVLSSRRSAQLCMVDSHSPAAAEFSRAKHRYWEGNLQRRSSNNSLMYSNKPTAAKIEQDIRDADECGGDPGIINAEGMKRKCKHFHNFNPCVELGLGKHSVCNLVTACLPAFNKDLYALERAIYLIARANYRQTCVDMRDGILQPQWHQANEALRLCGVSVTGICQADWLTDCDIRRLRNAAVHGAYSMADELDLPRPKGVTTGKPEGTSSKVFNCSEGLHKPIGKYIFNFINFSVHDPLVELHREAGYKILPNPSDQNNILVCFPVEYKGVAFERLNGKEVNLEPAISQLKRYLRWNNLWSDYNMSCTCTYSPEEIPEVARFIHDNWDNGFVAVALMRRTDPTMTPEQVSQPYLPQQVVTEDAFRDYTSRLRPVDFSKVTGVHDVYADECSRGACPVR